MGLSECGLNRDDTKKELQPHGTVEFPCAGYESSLTTAAMDIIPWHWHEELEFIYLKKGTLKLQVPFSEYTLQKGDLAIINSNVLHYAAALPFCELQSLVCSPSLLSGNRSFAFWTKYLQPVLSCSAFTCTLFSPSDSHLAEYFQTAFHALRSDLFGYEFTVREQLSHIILELFLRFEDHINLPRQAMRTDTLRLEQMLEYIHTHYREPITLSDISGTCGIGERECLRCFKRTIGDSPVQYLLKYRLMQSASMLRSIPSASIGEISGACGFDYPSYFSKQFKRFYKCTPKEYRASSQD